MTNQGPIPERLMDLLAEEATQGLSAAQQAELDLLLAENPAADADGMRLAAAALELGAGPAAGEALPAALRASLEGAGVAAVEAANRTRRGPSAGDQTLRFPGAARGGPGRAWAGWLAAAACLGLAAAGWWTAMQGGIGGGGGTGPGQTTGPGGGSRLGTMGRYEEFAKEPGTVRMAWSDFALNGAPPTVGGVKGEVLWNEEEQTGYLLFEGLPKNDPTKEQYQLWIVDSRGMADATGQSARISGAIFDAVDGTFVVPITPAIPVRGAGAFAVTIEKPGGTWVSDMTRRVVIASKG